jgi:orotidine-5'-phosphate decarboxylase
LADKNAADEAQEDAARANRKRILAVGAVGVVCDANVGARIDEKTAALKVKWALPGWKSDSAGARITAAAAAAAATATATAAAIGGVTQSLHPHPAEVTWRLVG